MAVYKFCIVLYCGLPGYMFCFSLFIYYKFFNNYHPTHYLKIYWTELRQIFRVDRTMAVDSGGFTGGGNGGMGGRAPPPVVHGRRMKKGRKINPNSPNMAISSLMQWLHETMFAIVIFKICRQLLGASPSCPTGAPLDLAG